MNVVSESIQSKIAKTEREINTALAKAEDYSAKAVEQKRKAEELRVFLQHLKNWASEFGGTGSFVSPQVQPDFTPPAIVQVRALVKEALATLSEFASGELVSVVQALNSDAKKTSILGELSKCKSRGDVTLLAQNWYRSCLYQGEHKATNQMLDVADVDKEANDDDPFSEDAIVKEVNNEPGPNFGRIS